jgi:hypothetical protein
VNDEQYKGTINRKLLEIADAITHSGRREMFLSLASYDPDTALRYLQFVDLPRKAGKRVREGHPHLRRNLI